MANLVMTLAIALVCVGCGKKDDNKITGVVGSAVTPGSAAPPTGPVTGSGSSGASAGSSAVPVQAMTPAVASCETACAHRKSCAVTGGDDVAKCTAACKEVGDFYTGEVLAQYAKAPCPEVVQAEAGFRGAMACKPACAHRASCITEASDQKQCLGDCTAAALVAGDAGIKQIESYTAADCAVAKEQEPGFKETSACVSACKYVIGCGVEGTFPACLVECAGNLAKKVYGIEQLATLQKASCDDVKKSIKITPLAGEAASAPPAPAGGSGYCPVVCKKYNDCGLQAYAPCMTYCATMHPDKVLRFANASCQQLRTGDLGDIGTGCRREGTQDCQVGNMCCRRLGNPYLDGGTGRATLQGEQGTCMYAALCYR